MLFPSVSFLFYMFPLFILAYLLLPFRNITILIFSLLFYTWGEGYYVFLLLFTVAINYFFGYLILAKGIIRGRLYLALGIAANLFILFYYKYFGFLFQGLFHIQISSGNVPHLPLGISFFTFQSITYLFDIYRREAEPSRSFTDLAVYITMFPQLIAGPIVRYASVAKAIRRRVLRPAYIIHGIIFFVVGLSQKVLIANHMAEIADPIFRLPLNQVSTAMAWIGSVSYMLQIYFDFSGYSNMALGIGLIMGFKFPQNFNYPYISQSGKLALHIGNI